MITAPVFGNHMVLQRDKPIRVWGTGTVGTQITAALGEAPTATATVRSDGSWDVTFGPQPAARGLTLSLSDGEATIDYRDVSVGEVWVAGGQSNMEFQLEFDAERDDVLARPMNPDIRFFDVPKTSYAGQAEDYDYSLFGFWRTCSPEDLRYFSAVGYYFAEQLQGALDVPIGIVGCDWGGTPACAWTSADKLAQGPGRVWIDDYEAGLDTFDADEEALVFRAHKMSDRTNPFGDPLLYKLMRDGLTDGEERQMMAVFAANVLPTTGLLHPNRPGGLFETMVKQIAGYGARGVIWYQGESDVAHPDVHSSVLSALEESWREAWQDGALAFLLTQLAPFDGTPFGNGDRFPAIRAQQARAAAELPNTWIASASDAGLARDIHPKIKRPIGHRLALLARGHVYGEELLCEAPAFDRIVRTEDGLRIHLEHARGLHWRGSSLPLTLTPPPGQDSSIGSIRIEEESVRINGNIPAGTEVIFAQSGYYTVDLCNDAGIPAFPFTSVVP